LVEASKFFLIINRNGGLILEEMGKAIAGMENLEDLPLSGLFGELR
jgi:hypothetical protein